MMTRFCVSLLLSAAAVSAVPVVPGYDKLSDKDIAGEVLMGELNCVACHSAESAAAQRLNSKTAPDLNEAGKRLTPQYLQAFLNDPHGTKAGTMMPDVLNGAANKAQIVEELTHFLISKGGPVVTSTDALIGGELAGDKNEPLPGGGEAEVEIGKNLFHTIGCVACHAPENAGDLAATSVPLGNLAMKTTVTALTDFLKNPHKARPSGRMPNLRLSEGEAKSLAVYLLREQLENPQAKEAGPASKPGVAFKIYHGQFADKEDKLKDAKVAAEGIAKNFTIKVKELGKRKNDYAFVYEAAVKVEKAGEYTFYTNSDDASHLFVDGKHVVKNPGLHGMVTKEGKIKLTAGPHQLKVTFAQHGGGAGLQVMWKPPGSKKKQGIPDALLTSSGGKPMIPLNSKVFVVDKAKASAGKGHFAKFGCASCHNAGVKSELTAKTLKSIGSSGGCLSSKPGKGVPNFGLAAAQRAALTKAVKGAGDLSKAIDARAQVAITTARFNCIACHERDGVGGPKERDEHFKMTHELDLGDEGRLPPSLTGAGSKLKLDALKGIIHNAQHHIRPYMATRMPSFPEAHTGKLADAFVAADLTEADAKVPEFSKQAVKDGRQLTGINGLGCINCHKVAGQKSLGIDTVDLATVGKRLNPGWMTRFLQNPAAINKGTRMPAFWLEGAAFKDIAGGDATKQQEAIYSYLSLGKSMPLPEGIKSAGDKKELVPAEPLVLRTFVKDASPRGFAIGYPERVHAIFDANNVRMAQFWRGKFFDPTGAWSGRTMGFNGPLGEDVLNLPPGPTFALLVNNEAPWPEAKKETRNVGGRFKGYRHDANRLPILIYELEGVRIEEKCLPELEIGGASMLRHFTLAAEQAPDNMYLMLAAGQKVEAVGAGAWKIDDRLTVKLRTPQNADARIRKSNNSSQLLLPVGFNGGKAEIEVMMSW
jgi:mono/diheme cytochrome c family protein